LASLGMAITLMAGSRMAYSFVSAGLDMRVSVALHPWDAL